jgi:hypothetical protein
VTAVSEQRDPQEQPHPPAPGDPPVTGDEAVDEAAAALAGVADEPLEVRLGVLERVHRTLLDRLADVGE